MQYGMGMGDTVRHADMRVMVTF